MKKILFTILTFLAVVGVANAATNLSEYFQEIGQSLPSFSTRAEMAVSMGLVDKAGNWSGTAIQNTAQLNNLQGSIGGSGSLPITDFESTLTAPITSTATTIPIASMVTTDGHTLTTADITPAAYFVLDSNNSNKKEIVKCMTISSSSFTGCTRGLAFYGTSEAEVSANKKSHSAGTDIILSNVHFYYLSTSVANTWIADQTFASSTAPLDQRILIGTTTPAYFQNNAGILYYCNNGASCAAIGAGANTYTFNRPLYTSGSEVKVSTSTNDFVLDGSGNLTVRKNANTIYSDANGLGVDTSKNYSWSGSQSFTATTTFANATTTGSLYVGGDFSAGGTIIGINKLATSTNATTTSNISDSTTETTLFTFNIPGNTLSTDNIAKMKVFISNFGIYNGTSTFRLKYGGTTIATASVGFPGGPLAANTPPGTWGSNTVSGYIEGTLFGHGATNSQKGNLLVNLGAGDVYDVVTGPGSISFNRIGFGTASIDSTAQQAFAVTIQYSTNIQSDRATTTSAYVEYLK